MPVGSDGLAEEILEKMVTCRAIDRVMTRHVEGHVVDGWWHSGEGHEGAQVGAAVALRRDDYLAYHYRGTGWVIGKGLGVRAILGDRLGRVCGSTGGKGGGIPHYADPDLGLLGLSGMLGSGFVVAGGAALAIDIRGTDQVAVAAFGDGTSARGTFHETMLSAASWNLPLIYFCENNQWFEGTRLDAWSPTETIAVRASAYGVPGIEVDGQDALAVHSVMVDAVTRAREGGGPSLIEAHVMRRRGHYVGDPQSYRASTDLADYRDPIDVLGATLEPRIRDAIITKSVASVEETYAQVLAEPEAGADILWKDVYA